MAGKTYAHSDAVLNVLRGTALTAKTPYAGLFTTAPANDGASGTELSGNGYARQSVTFSAPAAGTGEARKISNSATVTFGPATADWGTVVAFGIWDAATAGNLLYWANLTANKTVANGDRAEFAAGALTISED